VNFLSPRLARQAAVEEVDLLTMAKSVSFIKAGLLIDTVQYSTSIVQVTTKSIRSL
jgi:hypothetical protein